ncbi:hypothetical protein JL721_4830 [Aureococcus anophagefferens]|nr:hypothetical protein JL721_4830 [Aureococcus anophagefferens]
MAAALDDVARMRTLRDELATSGGFDAARVGAAMDALRRAGEELSREAVVRRVFADLDADGTDSFGVVAGGTMPDDELVARFVDMGFDAPRAVDAAGIFGALFSKKAPKAFPAAGKKAAMPRQLSQSSLNRLSAAAREVTRERAGEEAVSFDDFAPLKVLGVGGFGTDEDAALVEKFGDGRPAPADKDDEGASFSFKGGASTFDGFSVFASPRQPRHRKTVVGTPQVLAPRRPE